jgi:hypothetical protein
MPIMYSNVERVLSSLTFCGNPYSSPCSYMDVNPEDDDEEDY